MVVGSLTGPRNDPSPGSIGGARAAGDALAMALAALARWRDTRRGVVVVAIDGYGASGKSTLTGRLSVATGASLVHTDDFFVPASRQGLGRRPAASGVAAAPGPEAGRALGSFYDLARLRLEALVPLRAGRSARFRPFDWGSGTLSAGETRVAPNDLVLLEGVYSSAPELEDLVDHAVYVATPEPERLRRLRGSVAPEDWDDEWLQAERSYFEGTRPQHTFDLVVPGTGGNPPPPPAAHAPAGPRRVGDLVKEEDHP
jgi:uridine kinase